jgi:hypothetical protein
VIYCRQLGDFEKLVEDGSADNRHQEFVGSCD